MVWEANVSKVTGPIYPSHAAPVLSAELTMPAIRALPTLGPEPVPTVIPVLAG